MSTKLQRDTRVHNWNKARVLGAKTAFAALRTDPLASKLIQLKAGFIVRDIDAILKSWKK